MRYRDVSEYLPIADALQNLRGRGLPDTEAKEDLALALRDFKIRARAWRQRHGPPRVEYNLHLTSITVDSIDWQTSAVVIRGRYSTDQYDTLEIRREDVDRIWPATVNGGATAQPSTIAAEGRCEAWLKEVMTGPKHPGGKDKVFAVAQPRFAICRRGFDRAWAKAISETPETTWNKPGKPKSC